MMKKRIFCHHDEALDWAAEAGTLKGYHEEALGEDIAGHHGGHSLADSKKHATKALAQTIAECLWHFGKKRP